MGVTDEWDEDTGATDVEELQQASSAAPRVPAPCLTGTLSGQLFKVTKGQLDDRPLAARRAPAR